MNNRKGQRSKAARTKPNVDRFRGRDVISILDFSRADLEYLFRTAEKMRRFVKSRTALLSDRVMASLFFEPSTRTRLSFETAMNRLGGAVIGFSEPGVSSIAKGESLEDTIRMTDNYADIIVMRHPKEGSAQIAAEVANVPVINGGDGSQHHPTQAMIDLYTLWREFGEVDGLHAALVGDLKHARSTASFAYGLSKFKNVRLSLVSPSSLRARKEVMEYLSSNNVPVIETENMAEATSEADVIYLIRVQKERFTDLTEFEGVKGSYVLDLKTIANAKDRMIILHPLPRNYELPVVIDSSPHARYFEQASNGVPVRMALLALVLGKAL